MTQENGDDSYDAIRDDTKAMEKAYGFDLSRYRGKFNIRTALRDMVKPEDGQYIFEQLTKNYKKDNQ